jgi:hypothetical protein
MDSMVTFRLSGLTGDLVVDSQPDIKITKMDNSTARNFFIL